MLDGLSQNLARRFKKWRIQPGNYTTLPWYALEYLEKVANLTKKYPYDATVNVLVDTVNDIVSYTKNNPERIIHPNTVWGLVRTINAFPIKRLERQHITFMRHALRWGPSLLVEHKICQIILPKLLEAEAKKLTLALLEVILNDYRVISEMEEKGVREKQSSAIVKLCGVKAVQVALARIQEMIRHDASSFQMIQPIKSYASEDFPQSYSELLVNFTCSLFRLAEPDSIAETVENLLQKSHTVFKQIAP